MPNPALTSNSPGSGSISWGSFHLTYQGIDYAIAAGNTSHVYTYWLYNGGAGSALQFSDTQPTLTDDDCLLFINRGGIGINVQFAQLLDGDLIINGTVSAQAIIANAISTGQLAALSVTTGILAAGAVVADKIAANAISTDKLTVAALGSSLLGNGGFEDFVGTAATGWTPAWLQADSAATAQQVSSTAADVNGGGAAYKMTVPATSGASASVASASMPVSPGVTYAVSGFIKAAAAACTMTVKVYFGTTANFTAAAATASATVFSGAPTTAYAQKAAQVVCPTGSAYMRIVLQSTSTGTATTCNYDDLLVQPVTISAVIGNGSIDGKTITGSTFRTAASGKRVEINVARYDEINFYSGDAHEITPGAIQVSSFFDGPGPATFGEVVINSPDFGNGFVGITLTSATSASGGFPAGSITIEADTPGHIYLVGDTEITGAFTCGGATINGTTEMDEAQVGNKTLPRGSELSWKATTVPANTAVNGTEAVVYSAATVGSATIIAGRKYKLTLTGIVQMSAIQTGSQGSVRVRIGSGTGTLVLNIPVPIASTGLQAIDKTVELLGGTDIPVGSQSFAITNLGTGSSNMTTQYSAGQIYTNMQLTLVDVGA